MFILLQKIKKYSLYKKKSIMAVFGGIEQLKILSVWLNWGSQRPWLLPYTVSCLDDRLDLGFRGLLVISSALLRAGPSDHFSMNCNYRVAIINICWRIYINRKLIKLDFSLNSLLRSSKHLIIFIYFHLLWVMKVY